MLMIRLLALLSVFCASQALAQSSDWQKTWDETLAAARKEGVVVIAGSPDPIMRTELLPKFTERYGITVNFVAGRSGQIVARTRTERAVGIYTIDAYLAGAGTSFDVLYKEKMIDPLKPLLILPEVTDGSKWKRGKPWFIDPEEQYLLRLFSNVTSLFYVNADLVKPEDMRSTQDLLNPKWRGKISTEDPTDETGSGGNTAVAFYHQLGPDFVKKLYIDQQPVISRERRQFSDWLARGVYPICLSCRGDDMRSLQKEGFNIVEIYELEGWRPRVNSAPFLVSVANKAPHPNAVRVFINWLATKEPLELYSRNNDTATLRTDVDESFLNPRSLPVAGVSYFDENELQWRLVQKPEAVRKLGELLKKP
jgi:ABC-type Fe3+ transport system substrate-binding protein